MKSKFRGFLQLIILLGLMLSITGLGIEEVQAATCTWEGSIGTDWFTPGNWSGCLDSGGNPKHPGTDDDVIIPAGKLAYPVQTLYQAAIAINSLTIDAGGLLTIDEQTGITATQFTNNGTVTIEEVTGHYLRINSPFNNNGVVNIGSEAALVLYQSGTHSGSFTGRQLSFIKSTDLQRENTFQTSSSINVETLWVDEKNSVNVSGQISWDRMYIRTGSFVNLSSAVITNRGEVIPQGGSLILDNINLSETETLSGTGTIQADLTNAGTVSPGLSPGIIAIDGNYTQESTGTLEIEIGGTTPGTEYDQLVVKGTASMAGTLNVSLIDEFSPQLGDAFTILPYGNRSGGFNTMNLPDGYRWGVNYGYSGLTITVLERGSIQGTVTCSSTNTVFVDLYVYEPSPPPEFSLQINCNESYSFDDLPDGTYYIGAWIDLNESGDGPPDEGEPTAWYGEPSEVTIIDGETRENIDITFEGEGYHIFLPLIIR